MEKKKKARKVLKRRKRNEHGIGYGGGYGGFGHGGFGGGEDESAGSPEEAGESEGDPN